MAGGMAQGSKKGKSRHYGPSADFLSFCEVWYVNNYSTWVICQQRSPEDLTEIPILLHFLFFFMLIHTHICLHTHILKLGI
jgi:hypothetical protein